MIRY
jgi:hypothetical protein